MTPEERYRLVERELRAVRDTAWDLQVDQSLFLVSILEMVTGNGFQYFAALEVGRQDAILRQCAILAQDIHRNLESMQEAQP